MILSTRFDSISGDLRFDVAVAIIARPRAKSRSQRGEVKFNHCSPTAVDRKLGRRRTRLKVEDGSLNK